MCSALDPAFSVTGEDLSTSLTEAMVTQHFRRMAPRGARRAFRQTGVLVAGRAVAAAMSMAWMVLIARSLSEADVGALSLGLAMALGLSVLSDLGLPMIVADRVSRHPEQTWQLVRHVVRMRIVASGVTALLLISLYSISSDATLAVPIFMAVSVTATVVHTTATAALRGLGSVLPDSLNESVSRLCVLGVGAVALAVGLGIAGAAAVLAAADVISAVWLWNVLARRAVGRAPFPRVIISRVRVIPLAAALVVTAIHTKVDVWLLAVLGDPVDVAHYVVPSRIAEGLILPAGVATVLVLPLTGALESPRERGRQAARYVGLIACAVAIAGGAAAAVAQPLLRVIFGTDYMSDDDVLRVQCLAAIPSAIAIGLAPMVAILRRSALIAWASAALAVNVVANLALIPNHRELGAAWASVLSMTVAAIGMMWAVLTVSSTAHTIEGTE